MTELKPPSRLLMGPGPSNVSYRVLRAMSTPILGHLDPEFLKIMDQTSEMLRQVFLTQNKLTLPVSGTGSSGMETAFVNVVEPGDTVIIGVKGVFGQRMVDVARRCGAEIIEVTEEWGNPIPEEKMIDALKKHPEAKVCAIVHAETSTGVRQPIEEIGAFVRGTDTLFLVDAVTSLGGVPLRVDDWGIDVCYSATQKCLSVPPGLSPITISSKAQNIISNRKQKVQSWYLDLNMLQNYWGKDRVYHHTAPISIIYALWQGLVLILEEGLEKRWERHQTLGDELKKRMQDRGFKMFAKEGYRLPNLTAAYLPDGMDDLKARRRLLNEFDIEIGAGLGPVAGKIWRIGLMGETCTESSVTILINAIDHIMSEGKA
jgi:alanine-glyoxylate transaminase / serine-glyoxylate transaminase / serine-pyruvate transaminase